MSKASKIIVLCEDNAHAMFVRRFLKKWGVANRKYTVLDYPNGEGSGKKFVKETLPKEVKALRSRNASTILLVVLDADEFSVDQVKYELDEIVVPHRGDEEQIAYIIPKWHIETWIAYLHGEDVDEEERQAYKTKYGKMAELKSVHPFIDNLVSQCKNRVPLSFPPSSLIVTCGEFKRIRDML